MSNDLLADAESGGVAMVCRSLEGHTSKAVPLTPIGFPVYRTVGRTPVLWERYAREVRREVRLSCATEPHDRAMRTLSESSQRWRQPKSR